VLRTHSFIFPKGCVRHIVPNAAGAFSGYNTRFATPAEQASVARAGIFSKEEKFELQCKSIRDSPTTGCGQQALKNA
jgi:hypothetical protein